MDQSPHRAATLAFQSSQPEQFPSRSLWPRGPVTLRISRQYISYSFPMEFAMLVLSSDKPQEVSISIWSSHELQNPLPGHARSGLSGRLWRWQFLGPTAHFGCLIHSTALIHRVGWDCNCLRYAFQ